MASKRGKPELPKNVAHDCVVTAVVLHEEADALSQVIDTKQSTAVPRAFLSSLLQAELKASF
jgi:hypothetical protein